jgi:hypothetical protein
MSRHRGWVFAACRPARSSGWAWRPALAGLALVCPTVAFAQGTPSGEPELVTDRPGFTETSEVVRRGYLQVESGLSYERDGEAGTVAVPEVLVRLGLSRRIELRLATDGLMSERVAGQRTTGAGDVEVAAKFRLLDQDRAGFDVAIIPILSLPTGSEAFSSGAADPTIKFTWARGLPAAFDLSGNYNLSSLSAAAGRFVQQALTVSLGHDLAGGFAGYVEAFGLTPMERDGEAGWAIDGGVSRLIGTRMQWDIEAGRGMTAAAPDWFIGVGFGIRGRVGR